MARPATVSVAIFLTLLFGNALALKLLTDEEPDADADATEEEEEEGGGLCFPPTAKALLTDGREVNVTDLHKGMDLFGSDSSFGVVPSPFLMEYHDGNEKFGKGFKNAQTVFVELIHECGGSTRPFRATKGHMVFAVDLDHKVGKPRLLPVGSIEVGKHGLLSVGCRETFAGKNPLLKQSPQSALVTSKVLEVRRFKANGIYNPLTKTGTAIIDGVACLNAVLPKALREMYTKSPLFAKTLKVAGDVWHNTVDNNPLPREWQRKADDAITSLGIKIAEQFGEK